MSHKPVVLCVDDQEIDRTVLEGVLGGAQYDLLFAENGPSAIEQALTHLPDLMLLDVKMPGMDGFEVCERLRSEARTAELPIVMLTALDDDDLRLRGLEVGADDFLTKPFNRAELRARVRTITRLNRYRRLNAERAKVDQLVRVSPDGILVADGDGTIKLANPTATAMFGQEDVTGHTILEFIVPEHQERAETLFPRVIKGEHDVQRLETQLARPDGGRAQVELVAKAFEWEGTQSCVVMLRDVSDRKAMEEQLRQAQKLEVIGQLTAGVAHDFKNILSIVLTNAELTIDALPEESEERSNLSDIVTAAETGSVMIRKLLGLSRKADLRLERTNLVDVVVELPMFLNPLLREHVDLKIDVPDVVPEALADAAALQQMMMNLATNARDAMPEGGALTLSVGEVTVTDRDGHDPGAYVYVQVRDTGVGMDEETKSRIFEPFFTTKPPGKGTGLGMPMIAGLMKQHRGFVTVDSTPGVGTAIILHFRQAERHHWKSTRVTLVQAKGASEIILIVDDDRAVRRVAERALRKFGYRTFAAVDGADGLALFRQHRDEIDLVISDVNMPGMSGIELFAAVREERPDVKFMFSSGHDGSSSDSGALVDDVELLPKPWTLTELATRVREMLDL